MINRVKCPNCGDTENITYAVNTTVYFWADDLEVQIDLDHLQGDIEENTPMTDVICECESCGHRFSGGDAPCV